MAIVHLFHLWDKSPQLIRETAVGYTLCNRKVGRASMVRFPCDANCPACLARVVEKEAPAQDRGAVPKPQNSLPRNHKQGASDDEH
jgi:hypothetical protein